MTTNLNGRRWPPVFFLAAFLFHSAPGSAEEHFFTRLDSFSWSEPVTIDAAINDWQGAFFNGQRQFSHTRFDFGLRFQNWEISAQYRRDISLRFTRDTAEYYYLSRNHIAVDPERRFSIDLRARQAETLGIRLGSIGHRWHRIELSSGISLFRAKQLIDGYIQGTERNVDVDYLYSKDVLFERDVPPPDGYGVSLDLSLNWSNSHGTTINIAAVDLPGFINWQHAPFTRATANIDQSHIDEQGYLTVEPLVSGIEGSRSNYWQHLHPQLHLAVTHRLSHSINALFDYRYLDQNHFTAAGVEATARGNTFGIRYRAATGTIDICFGRAGMRLSIGADSIPLKDSRSLWLRFEIGGTSG